MALSILFSGDVVIQNDTLPDSSIWDTEMEQKVSKYKYRCCNFEGAICGKEEKKIKKIGPHIRIASAAVPVLKKSGFNIAALANNHAMDFGQEGLKNTIREWGSLNTIGAGFNNADIYQELILTDDDENIRVGILNAAENGFGAACDDSTFVGYAWINSPMFYEKIKQVRSICDYLVVIAHCGVERLEYPLPEWRNLFKYYIDELGVDAIVAHHPHVVQGYEEHNGGVIFYSLGNFIWDKKPLYSNETIIVGFTFSEKKMSYEVIPVCVNEYKVSLNKSIEFKKKIERLCSKLKVEQYNSFINHLLDSEYVKRYISIYYSSIGLRYGGLKCKLFNLIHIFIGKDNLNDVAIFHNVSIESHQWLLRRISKEHLELGNNK